jgi:carbamoyl-phosphate synthase large subunit
MVSDPDLVRTCRDKALTCQRLLKEGIPVPKSSWDLPLKEALAWANSNGYPVVIKPRSGSASRHMQIVRDDEELLFYYPRTPAPIIQEYLTLSGTEEEYTCAIFADRSGSVTGTFMARRELTAGDTYRAEVNFWPEINGLLLKIAAALRSRGPVNVQLRQTERGPVPFELNLRCSGTTAIRAYFGYNEPEMLLRHYVLGEPLAVPKPRTGYAFRYLNEVFLDGVTYERLLAGPTDLKGSVLAWP